MNKCLNYSSRFLNKPLQLSINRGNNIFSVELLHNSDMTENVFLNSVYRFANTLLLIVTLLGVNVAIANAAQVGRSIEV